jgi:hypothetical protein
MSGKSVLIAEITKHLDIESMTIKDTVDLCKTLETPVAKEVILQYQLLKDKAFEEFEKIKKKGQEMEKEAMKVKLPDKTVADAFRSVIGLT